MSPVAVIVRGRRCDDVMRESKSADGWMPESMTAMPTPLPAGELSFNPSVDRSRLVTVPDSLSVTTCEPKMGASLDTEMTLGFFTRPASAAAGTSIVNASINGCCACTVDPRDVS